MKTQLLQDFNESGSAPAATTAAPPRQEPGRRPRQEAVQASAPAPQQAPAPVSASIPAAAPASAGAATLRPRGFAPQPPGFGQPVPPREDTTAQWSPDTTGGRDPDWLAERLARDTAMHDRSEWTGGWTRHLATWGAAGVLLALLAGGGLWLYEQSQVDGALVVVANTNPAPDTAAARSVPGLPTARVPGIAPVSTSAPLPAAVEPAPRTAITPANASGDTASAEPVRDAQPETVSRPESAAPPKRQRSQSRRHPKAVASAAIPDSEPSARQRREETLMQCRAHGYDDHQCVQRGCEMTRYGFACKG